MVQSEITSFQFQLHLTTDKLPSLFVLQFLICKMGIKTVLALWVVVRNKLTPENNLGQYQYLFKKCELALLLLNYGWATVTWDWHFLLPTWYFKLRIARFFRRKILRFYSFLFFSHFISFSFELDFLYRMSLGKITY